MQYVCPLRVGAVGLARLRRSESGTRDAAELCQAIQFQGQKVRQSTAVGVRMLKAEVSSIHEQNVNTHTISKINEKPAMTSLESPFCGPQN